MAITTEISSDNKLCEVYSTGTSSVSAGDTITSNQQKNDLVVKPSQELNKTITSNIKIYTNAKLDSCKGE